MLELGGLLRWTPHPVIVTIRDSKDYNKVLLYSYYATIRGGGPPKGLHWGFRAQGLGV